ncbi:MAG: hypothetical protein ACKVU4_12955, partial [Phycisphaerales bacterium]
YDTLRRAAARAAAADANTPPPAGLDAALARPIPADAPDAARATLAPDAVRRALLASASRPPIDRAAASPEQRLAALRRYVAGREKLLTGDARGAAADLRAATALDDAAPEPWRELGEAQAAVGAQGEAAVSFQAAVERGLAEARALEFLARLSEERAEPARAAEWYALAATKNPAAEDPALPLVIGVGLGRSLLRAGYLEAGRTTLAESLELPGRVPSPTRYAQELAMVYRRQGELWRDIGDADLKLGRYDRALGAYERAADLPTLEDPDLAPRVFFAASRAGKPAAAALFVLDRIAAARGFVSRDNLALLSSLGSDRATARELARALSAYAETLPTNAPPAAARSLVRARAAVLGGPESTGVLRAHLRRHPGDAAAAALLLGATGDPAGEGAHLAAASPGFADRYADAIARVRDDADRVASALAQSTDDGAKLLAIYLHSRLGRLEDARVVAEKPDGWRGGLLETRVAEARLAAAQGRWDDAEAILAVIDAAKGRDQARARAQMLWALRRARATLEAMRPLLEGGADTPAARLEDLLLAAEAADRSGQPDEAEKRLRAALAIDPHDDRTYLLLTALYGPSGPLSDTDKLGLLLRDLRANNPDSRLASFIRAQEFSRRSFFDPAERELRRLADTDPTDPAVLEMLSGVWVRRAKGPDDPSLVAAAKWLHERVQRRPWSDALAAAHARVLASSGRADEAEKTLRDRLATRPRAEVSRVLEVLVRERGRANEADDLAEARLGRTPCSIDEAIEWAEFCARKERDADAAEAVARLAPPGTGVTAEEARRLRAAAGAVAGRAIAGRAAAREPAVRMLDELARRSVMLSPELHDQRLSLLTGMEGVDAPRLIAAAEDAARDFPSIGAAPFLRVCQLLIEARRPADAIRVIEKAADKEPGIDVLVAWIRMVPESGTPDDARRAIDRAVQAGRMREVADRLLTPAPGETPDPRDPRAAIAYELGVAFASFARQPESIALYELALEYDPRHPLACNNLGYHLVESGGDLVRAEHLLQIAHEEAPDDASILDSLAWLRYKNGVLESVAEAGSGRTVKQGAVELLERATRTDRGRQNQTIQDHFGDALWIVGRRDEARRAWTEAERLAAERLRDRQVRQSPPDSPLRRELTQVRAGARSKIEAMDRGAEPQVAPRLAGPAPAGDGD